MRVNVKRSDLLRLYRLFSDIFPEVNTVSLILDSYHYILLSKIVCSVFNDNAKLDIDSDDETPVLTVYQSLTVDKDILSNVLYVMDQHAVLNEEGNIYVEFTNASQILSLLETFLLKKNVSIPFNQNLAFVMEEKVFSIHNKLGYANFTNQASISKKPYLKTGAVVRVADNSGAKFVKIVSEIEPSVYIVTIEKTSLKDRVKFPYGKTYCGILVRFSESGYYSWDEVCLFEYYDGVKQQLFTSIPNGTVALCTNLSQYKAIIQSCIFKKDDCIRIDSRTSAKIQRILKVTPELEGSEFLVKLLSDLYLPSQSNFKKGQLVKGVLKKRLFENTNSFLSYYPLHVYELEISFIIH
jgi:hypothetical protein